MIARGGGDAERPEASRLDPQVEKRILDAVRSIRFGAVEVVVHDGRVVQIETKEKIHWHLTDNFKFTVDYIRTEFKGGAPNGDDRETENAVVGRFQVAF